MYYEQTGDGPDIVWLPGGDQRGRDMRWQVEGFPDFRNTTMDPRGAGETGVVDAPPWSILDMARDCCCDFDTRDRLPGCQVPIFPTFSRWIDNHRNRLRLQLAAALWS